jgi:hypothetical protein
MAAGDLVLEHLLRRAGFGASSAELSAYSQLSYAAAVDRLVNYDASQDSSAPPPAALFHPTPLRTTRGSDGCFGWCTPTVRCRRR